MCEPTLPPIAGGLLLGLRFHEGHFYKWSDRLGAWGLVEDEAASAALASLVALLNELPFAVPLSAAMNTAGGSSHATH